MTMRRLVLLRHGQTDYNVQGRMQGHIDSVLTEAGREQAVAVAPAIGRLTPGLLISSDLQRAIDTADLVGSSTSLPVKLDARLRETHLGEWQGRTVADIEEQWPGAIATWRSDPSWAPPGGESRLEVVRRSRPVVEEIDDELAGDDDTTVVLVAHGGLIAGLVSALLALPTATWPTIGGMGNCRWAMLARRGDHPRWRLAGYNVGVGL
ncbi:histidine phosphatase family protein [Pseudonocardia sp. GCM10023141]|uniref:histidine phosphatase family protein n=1 Tax=Pseudonocardia sp. GCM10023141 TaxID=3252653 RepID=UPI00360CB85D